MAILCSGLAASSLSAGDVAIIGFNSDNPDEFGFVVLVDLEAGTEVYFTDSGVSAEGTFRGGEGAVKFTAPAQGVPAGTVIIYDGTGSDFVSANDSNVGTSGFALSSSGDQIIVFQDSSTAPSFIYALNVEGSGWQSDATSSNETVLPPGLVDGTSALALEERDNGFYSASSTNGTSSDLLQSISKAENWTTSNTRIDSNTWVSSFSVSSDSFNGTTVQFGSSGATVPEDSSSYDFFVTITNGSSADQTSADVVLTSNGTGTNGSDLSLFATRTLSFPAGTTSPQSVTVMLVDDTEFEGSETLVFELQNVGGGDAAAVGSPAEFTLTIEDNDSPAVVFNEIHYNPAVEQGADNEYEFLELYNRSVYTVSLSGYHFREGIDLILGPSDSLAPQSYLVLAKDGTTYPGSIQWTGGNLANSGETLVLTTERGALVDSLTYTGGDPWPGAANGEGPSLELMDPWLDNSLGQAWQASYLDGGTPGNPNSSNSAPQAIGDSFSVNEDQLLIVSPPGVLGNDLDADGDDLTAVLTGSPLNGDLVLSSDGGFEYMPDPDFFGDDSFEYAVHDGMDTSATAFAVLKVRPVNDAPDSFELVWPEDSTVIVITREHLTQAFIMAWEEAYDRDGDSVTYDLMGYQGLSFLTVSGIQDIRLAISYEEVVEAMGDSDLVEGAWTVWASDGDTTREADNGPFRLTLDISSMAFVSTEAIPTAFALYPNIPNPFNPSTRIPYDVPRVARVRIDVYDVLGRRVHTVVSGIHQPGKYEERFGGINQRGFSLASGIYICRMVALDLTRDEVIFNKARKLVVIK